MIMLHPPNLFGAQPIMIGAEPFPINDLFVRIPLGVLGEIFVRGHQYGIGIGE